MISRSTSWLLVLGALIAFSGVAHSAELDDGGFRIYLNGREMGRESFIIDQYADSIIVQSSRRHDRAAHRPARTR